MEFVEKLSGEFEKAAKSVVKETNKVIKTTKLSLSITDLEGKLDDIYKEIGKKFYEYNERGKDEMPDFSEQFEKARALKKEIEEVRETLLNVRNRAKCEACGSEIGKTDIFCKKCGEKIAD